MTDSFTDGNNVVVTRVTRAGDCPMIEPCRSEIRCRVAVVASCVGRDMPSILAFCPHSVVALGTSQGCAFENATHMAGAAVDQVVRPGKRKPGEEVIVLLCLLRRRQRGMKTRQQHQQPSDWSSDQ